MEEMVGSKTLFGVMVQRFWLTQLLFQVTDPTQPGIIFDFVLFV